MTKQSEIAHEFRKNIANQLYQAKDKLPTEAQLMDYYQVSRNTIRQTLKTLESEGYIYSIQGSGYYVRDIRIIESLYLKSLSEVQDKHQIKNKLLDYKIIPATLKLAKIFDIPLNTKCIYFERLRFKDHQPVMLEKTNLPTTLFKNFKKEDALHSIFSYVEQTLDLTLTHSVRDYTSVILTPEECELFSVDYPTSALLVTSTGYLVKEHVFEYSTILEINGSHSYIARR